MHVGEMRSTVREFCAGAPLGDVAVLKLDALAESSPDLENRPAGIQGYAPDQELEKLRAMREGTLGRCDAGFLDAGRKFLKAVLIVALASACSEPAPPEFSPSVAYHFEPANEPGSVEVVMTLPSAPGGSLELRRPPQRFGPFSDLARGIELGDVEGASLENTEDPGTLRLVWTHPGQPARIHYRLKQLYPGAPHDRMRVFWPAFQPDYWYFSATAALLAPVWPGPFAVTVFFAPPAGMRDWKLVSSRGVAEDCATGCQIEFRVDDASELHADVSTALVFMFGRTALRHHVLFPEDAERRNEIYIAIYGLPEYAENQESLLEGLEKIVRTHQEFWGDPVYPSFVINIIGFENDAPNNFGGFNASQIFNSFVPRHAMGKAWAQGDRMLPRTDWVGLLSHVAHEYGHTWIHPGLVDGETEKPGYFVWLMEGATEYRADRVLLGAGLIDMNAYVKRFNQKLGRYDGPYASARSADLESILAGFWSGDYAIQRQPYLRGNLLAHDWNARILRRGVPGTNFDALLREWVEQGRRTPLSAARIDSLSREFIEEGVASDVQQHWLEGEIVSLDPDALGRCFSLEAHDGVRQFERRSGITDAEWVAACRREPPGWSAPRPRPAQTQLRFDRAPLPGT
ncbi:MAG: hypothetical protein HRU00_05960 [Myxococcales bacterium]|nr:hypothetical protein [Myxococcales bacterium]